MTQKSPCDCCGKIAVLRNTECCGVETYACAECHGYPADEFDYMLDDNEEEQLQIKFPAIGRCRPNQADKV